MVSCTRISNCPSIGVLCNSQGGRAVVLWGTGIGQFFFSIRKQHTVNKGTRVQGNGSEYFSRCCFFLLF